MSKTEVFFRKSRNLPYKRRIIRIIIFTPKKSKEIPKRKTPKITKKKSEKNEKFLKKLKSNKIKEIPNHSTSEFSDKSNNYCVCIPVINEGDKIKNQFFSLKLSI